MGLHTSRHTRKNSSFSIQGEHLVLLGLEALTQPPTSVTRHALISSHSRNKNNKSQIERQRLVRLRVNRDTGEIENVALNTDKGLLEKLPEELTESTQRRPGEKNAEGKDSPGFNIEGLA